MILFFLISRFHDFNVRFDIPSSLGNNLKHFAFRALYNKTNAQDRHNYCSGKVISIIIVHLLINGDHFIKVPAYMPFTYVYYLSILIIFTSMIMNNYASQW